MLSLISVDPPLSGWMLPGSLHPRRRPASGAPSCSGAVSLIEAPLALCHTVVEVTLSAVLLHQVCAGLTLPAVPRAKGAPEQHSRLPPGEWPIPPEYLGLPCWPTATIHSG